PRCSCCPRECWRRGCRRGVLRGWTRPRHCGPSRGNIPIAQQVRTHYTSEPELVMKHLIVVLLLFAAPFVPFAGAADIGIIQHMANLRRDPSSAHAPIRKLFPDEKVEVQGATQADYVKVKTEDQVTGWVFKAFMSVLPAP